MNKVVCTFLAVAFACVCGVSAYAQSEIPELNGAAITLDGAKAQAPAVQAGQADTVKTLTILVDKKEQADSIGKRLGDYLGPRLKSQQVVDHGFMGKDLVLTYTGSDLSGWVSLYKEEDARAGFYYLGPTLTDEQAKEFQARADQAREDMVKYLESDREWLYFSKAKVKVIYSHTILIRMPAKNMDGKPIELVNPYTYLYVDGALTDSMIHHLNKNKFIPFAIGK